MMWKDVVNLVAESMGENEMGDVIPIETKKQVFANKKSVRQSEFYQAQAHGLKPEIMFEIHSVEYEDETKVEFNNRLYKIIRSYEKGGITELVCEGAVNNANA